MGVADNMGEIQSFFSLSRSVISYFECPFFLIYWTRSPQYWLSTLFFVTFSFLNIPEFLASHTFQKMNKGMALHTHFKKRFFIEYFWGNSYAKE